MEDIMARTAADHIACDHPFQCEECGSCFTTARFAAKCCKASCVDLRDGSVTVYSDEAEARMAAEAEAAWAIESAKYVYECSCGERYMTVSGAIQCRKCRYYTEEEWCTTVIDTRTDEVVWERYTAEERAEMAARRTEWEAEQAAEQARIDAVYAATREEPKPLTHNPFANLSL